MRRTPSQIDQGRQPVLMAKSESDDRLPGRKGLRVLIIEDLADSALTTAMLLRLYGHDVQISANGLDGIESARQGKPDVVLLDIGLPGIDGHAVAEKISRERTGRTPLLIAITGFGQESDRRRSEQSGIDLHLLKPVEPPVLESILRDFQSEICPTEEEPWQTGSA